MATDTCDVTLNFSLPVALEYIYDKGDEIVIYYVYPIIMVLGILTNGAFCIVVGRVSRMRTVTNLYLVNLAVADMTFLFVVVTDKLIRISSSPIVGDESIFGLAGCIIVPFILDCAYFASICIVTLVTLEKFYAICRPLKHRKFEGIERTIKLLIGGWVSSACLAGLFIPARAKLDVYCALWPPELEDMLPPVISYCSSDWPWYITIVNVMQTVPFFVAMTTNFVLYINIFKTMHTRVGVVRTGGMQDNREIRLRNQVGVMLVANGVVFFMCQVLFQSISIALAFRDETSLLTNAQINKALLVARILTYLNSSVNPIIYSVFSSRYRHAFKEVFGCRKQWRIHPSTVNTELKQTGTSSK